MLSKNHDLIDAVTNVMLQKYFDLLDNPSLEQYIKRTAPSSLEESSEDAFLEKAYDADIVFFGEIHNSKTILKENFRLFRIISSSIKSPSSFCLCLEFLPSNVDAKRYINGEITLKGLFKEVRKKANTLSLERITGKVFDPKNYKDILKYCRRYKIDVFGIDERNKQLKRRDITASNIIYEKKRDYDKVFVFGGNHHMHPSHIPKILMKRFQSQQKTAYLLNDHEMTLSLKNGFYKDTSYDGLFYRRLIPLAEFFKCYYSIIREDTLFDIDISVLRDYYEKRFNKEFWYDKKHFKRVFKGSGIKVIKE